MTILNQPFEGQLGDLLMEQLGKAYTSFTLFSAFAKNSGVLRLAPALRQFQERGGTVTAFIGVDQNGTSYDALENLLPLCDRLYVVHSESRRTTYHTKIYLLENEEEAWCAVGSNNLTGGGLWGNYENCVLETFALPEEAAQIAGIRAMAQKYQDPAYPCARQITGKEDLDILQQAGYINKEGVRASTSLWRRLLTRRKPLGDALFGAEEANLPPIKR